MKKLLIITFFFNGLVFGQIKEMEDIEKETIGEYYLNDNFVSLQRIGENEIVFFFKNEKYKQITDVEHFSFKDIDDSLNQLYNYLINGIKTKSNSEKSLELPDKILRLNFGTEKGIGFVDIKVQDKNIPSKIDFLPRLNENAVNSLFGKEIKENVISTTSTDWNTLTSNGKFTLYYRITNVDGNQYLNAKIMTYSGISSDPKSINEGKKLTLYYDDGSFESIYNSNNEEPCIGCGSVGLSGSAALGVEVYYILTDEFINKTRDNIATIIEFETNTKNFSYDLKRKKAEELKKEFQIFSN